jgi:putative ABC transport system permease protein
VAALVYGLVPALVASSPDLATALRESGAAVAGGGRGARARQALVVLETALALTLLVGAGNAAKGLARLQRSEPGFDPAGVLTARLNLSASSHPGVAEKAAFTRELLARVAALPGVRAAGTIDVLPLSGQDYYWSFTIEGRPPVDPADVPLANFRTVSPGFLAALGIPLRAGRDFTDHDAAATAPVVLVNETLAARHFPGQSALGKRLSFTDPPAAPVWQEIVGVVGDVKQSGLDGQAFPDVYVAQLQAPRPYATLVMRTDGPPAALASAVRAEVGRLDRDQPVFDVKPMSAYLEESTARPRLLARLLTSFAGVALLLAAVGTYGVVSHLVGQRTRELAIRSALGATRGSIVGVVLRQALALVSLGIALGAVAGLTLTQVLSRLLHGVGAWDVPLLLGAATILALVSLAAAGGPAGRATRADPMALLRAE